MAVVMLDELRRNGVESVVIAPGSRSAALSMSALSMGFDVHTEIDERSAGFFALGLGIEGVPAALVTTSGTAVANLLPAVVEADLSNRPLIVMSADRPPELRDRGANQTIEQSGIFGRRVRWEFDPGPAEDRPESNDVWRSAICRAVAASRGLHGDRPGPVHLNLPFREPLVPATDDGRTAAPQFVSSTEGRPDGAPWSAVGQGERWSIGRSDDPERTLVIIGDTSGHVDLDLRGVAFVAEPHSNTRSPEAMTGLHFLATHPSGHRLRPDRVITIGRVGLSRQLGTWLRDVSTTSIDPSGRWLDPSATATQVMRVGAVPVADPKWLKSLAEIDRAIHTSVTAEIDAWEEMSEPRIARDTARAAFGGRLVVASSMPIRDLDLFMDTPVGLVVSNRGASGIDGFVSTVLGVASTAGDPVVALAGDLSMLHDSNGFLLAERPDCVFVVVDNDGGGIFSFLPQADYQDGFEAAFGTPHGRSFERLAEFYGLGYVRVDRPDELQVKIDQAMGVPGVSLVHAKTDRDRNVAHHRRLTEVAHQAIDRVV
jgi:2-succinyl-5-enolpyruvyl-6-hydroxy-3-cyclohexene-1-carboxylate synthase